MKNHDSSSILTASEIAEGEKLSHEYAHLSRHHALHSHDGARAFLAKALDDYREQPTDENHLAAVVAGMLLRQVNVLPGSLRAATNDVLNLFYVEKVRPWAYKIVLKNLLRASAYADRMVAAERQQLAATLGEERAAQLPREICAQHEARAVQLIALEKRLLETPDISIHALCSPEALLREFGKIEPLPADAPENATDPAAQTFKVLREVITREWPEKYPDDVVSKLVPIKTKHAAAAPASA
jgi:hypothetical protein